MTGALLGKSWNPAIPIVAAYAADILGILAGAGVLAIGDDLDPLAMGIAGTVMPASPALSF